MARQASKRHHYISQFHLKGFTALEGTPPQEPWLWFGNIDTQEIRRRAPQNIAWESQLFADRGGRAEEEALEIYLGREIEGPASAALRRVAAPAGRDLVEIPGDLTTYLGWLAAKSAALRPIYEFWLTQALRNPREPLDPPPDGFVLHDELLRPIVMEHSTLGRARATTYAEAQTLARQGWIHRLEREDFSEVVHAFAWLFNVRHFPRLKWARLEALENTSYIIGDVPVVWSIDGRLDHPPGYLAHPSAQLVAPLTRDVSLIAVHRDADFPAFIPTEDVNQFIAGMAQHWIAGPDRATVERWSRWRARTRRSV